MRFVPALEDMNVPFTVFVSNRRPAAKTRPARRRRFVDCPVYGNRIVPECIKCVDLACRRDQQNRSQKHHEYTGYQVAAQRCKFHSFQPAVRKTPIVSMYRGDHVFRSRARSDRLNKNADGKVIRRYPVPCPASMTAHPPFESSDAAKVTFAAVACRLFLS